MVLVYANAGPEERGRGLLDRAFARGGEQRGEINQFFDDPQRQQEINETVDIGLQRALRGIGNQISERARQEAFARARSGNIGGSNQAVQGARLNADMLGMGAQASGLAEAQRFALNQQLQRQQQNELLNSFGLDPFTQQSIRAILQGQNVQGQGNQAAFELSQNRRQQQAFANDELSRNIGNVLNIGGQTFQTDQMAKAFGGRGIF